MEKADQQAATVRSVFDPNRTLARRMSCKCQSHNSLLLAAYSITRPARVGGMTALLVSQDPKRSFPQGLSCRIRSHYFSAVAGRLRRTRDMGSSNERAGLTPGPRPQFIKGQSLAEDAVDRVIDAGLHQARPEGRPPARGVDAPPILTERGGGRDVTALWPGLNQEGS